MNRPSQLPAKLATHSTQQLLAASSSHPAAADTLRRLQAMVKHQETLWLTALEADKRKKARLYEKK